MVAAAGLQATQAFVLSGSAITSEAAQVTQAAVYAAEDSNGGSVQVTQAFVLAAVAGRVNDPKIRAWTFTLDGHDYYVLRLGNTETLVYDTHSEQWYTFGQEDGRLWQAYNGANWIGSGKLSGTFGSNVIVGDDANGALYFLDPLQETDDDNLQGSEARNTFTRRVMGQVHIKGYNSFAKCFGVQLLGSIGDVANSTLTSVTLSYSDDRGKTFKNAGTIDITPTDYDGRVHWRSLGSFRSPGRLFKIEDTGALTRIDSLDMESNLDEG